MAKYNGVSVSVIKRLPRYHRFLGELIEKDVHRISSRELAHLMHLTASQIRQDLNCFGGFGQQGYGYNVDALYSEIGKILGINNNLKAILIGAGNLGMALANHMSFEQKGFQLTGVFDINENLVGHSIRGVKVSHISRLAAFCETVKPQVAILCIPKESAQEITETLINYGIVGFWNFSNYDMTATYEHIAVENVHLSDSLMTLCYHVNQLQEDEQ